jgi:RNA polymerase sigma factor (sigma-70 family)
MNTGKKHKSIKSIVDNAMLELPKDDYEILYELYFKNTSIHQLAKKLGITRPAVRYRRDKALERLKKIILKQAKI